ncbi:hypothetical protein D3C72_376570 [compost metagenome]
MPASTRLPIAPVPAARRPHQAAEPVKMPAISHTPSAIPAPVRARPSPAKTAAKDRMVIGLVTVRAKVEPKAPQAPRAAPAPAARSAGRAWKVFRPRYMRNSPPMSCSQVLWVTRKPDTTVRPKAATQP